MTCGNAGCEPWRVDIPLPGLSLSACARRSARVIISPLGAIALAEGTTSCILVLLFGGSDNTQTKLIAHKQVAIRTRAGPRRVVKQATERAQAEVDQRRRIAALADAFEADAIDADKVESAGQVQVKTAERLKSGVVQAVTQLHAVLDGPQRKKLAYLLRTGVLTI